MTLLGKRPARTIGTSRSCLTGQVSMATGGMASFESSLERDWFVALDFDPSVRSVQDIATGFKFLKSLANVCFLSLSHLSPPCPFAHARGTM